MKKVLLFDCDGVLGDTEKFGHLPAFNQMWKEFGVPWQWSEKQYGEKLKIGGGKERMASLFNDSDFKKVFDCSEKEDDRIEIVKKWHKRKTEIYKETINSGKIPARPGVKRLANDALDNGWILGVCSTSAQESVRAVLNHVMGAELAAKFSILLAGDVVKAKKPSPEIYNLAAKTLQVPPANCVVVEDSRNGFLAAQSAKMKCLVTVSSYTYSEDFSGASIVVTCLGDPDSESCRVLLNPYEVSMNNYFTVENLEAILNKN